MKKDSFQRKSSSLTVNKTKEWHRVHQRQLNKRRRSYKGHIRRRASAPPRTDATKWIVFPVEFSLTNNYKNSIVSISLIREHLQKGKKVVVDLRNCKNVTLEACLVLSAEVERCLNVFPGSLWGTYPKDEASRFLFDEMGFFQHLKVYCAPTIYVLDPTIEIVRVTSGKADKVVAEQDVHHVYSGMKSLFDKEKGGQLTHSRISAALGEAMENVVRYAYPSELREKDYCLPKWWRVGLNDKKDNTAMAVFYDLGVGIPSTLQTGFKWKSLLKSIASSLKRQPEDYEIIKAAIDQKLTSTKEGHHGQGLAFMRGVIDRMGNGFMVIMSQRALYKYSMPGKQVETLPLPVPMNGTLIMWQANYGRSEDE